MNMPNPGQITIGDLYREIVGMRSDIVKALTRIEVIDTRDTTTTAMLNDHETRLRIQEAFRWKLTGIVLFLSVVSGLFSGYAGYLLLGQH